MSQEHSPATLGEVPTPRVDACLRNAPKHILAEPGQVILITPAPQLLELAKQLERELEGLRVMYRAAINIAEVAVPSAPSETRKMPSLMDYAEGLSPEARAAYIQECREAIAAYAPSATPMFSAIGYVHVDGQGIITAHLEPNVKLPARECLIYIAEGKRV